METEEMLERMTAIAVEERLKGPKEGISVIDTPTIKDFYCSSCGEEFRLGTAITIIETDDYEDSNIDLCVPCAWSVYEEIDKTLAKVGV